MLGVPKSGTHFVGRMLQYLGVRYQILHPTPKTLAEANFDARKDRAVVSLRKPRSTLISHMEFGDEIHCCEYWRSLIDVCERADVFYVPIEIEETGREPLMSSLAGWLQVPYKAGFQWEPVANMAFAEAFYRKHA